MSNQNKRKNDQTVRNFPQQDAFQRMNYLLQASNEMSRVAYNNNNHSLQKLAGFYSHTARTIAKRAVCRLAPETKRSQCPKCHSQFIPGVNCNTEIMPHNVKKSNSAAHKRRKIDPSSNRNPVLSDETIDESRNYGSVRVSTTCHLCDNTSSTMKSYTYGE